MDHRVEAEKLLFELDCWRGDADWAQVHAVRALVHATLAGPISAQPCVHPEIGLNPETVYGNFSGADELPEVIAFQGDRAAGRLANNEPFTLRDSMTLQDRLDKANGYVDPLLEF